MSTPALARATEALSARWDDDPMAEGHDYRPDALAAVSAALHDPDDAMDSLALIIGQHEVDYTVRDVRLHCRCGAVDDSMGGHFVHVADAVRAVILGSDS